MLDIMLPGMDGVSILKKLRGNPTASDIPVIMATAKGTEYDKVIGLDRLKALHLNDSMNPLGAHKDRHAQIGAGHIGLETFRRVVKHPALRGLPFILETPNDDAGWAREIALLREMAEQGA